MVRTQIQLTKEQAAELKRIAAERKVSIAELAREGIDAVIHSARGVTREERKRRALALPSFRSGTRDLSIRHDDYLVESIVDPAKE